MSDALAREHLAEGLRRLGACRGGVRCDCCLILWEQADAILAESDALRADRDRLRAALAKLYGRAVGMEPPTEAELDEAWNALGWSGAKG